MCTNERQLKRTIISNLELTGICESKPHAWQYHYTLLWENENVSWKYIDLGDDLRALLCFL